MNDELRPSTAKTEVLNLAYKRFNYFYDELMSDSFWENKDSYRFTRIKDVFSIYKEIGNYRPLTPVIDYLKRNKPPMLGEIAGGLFPFIRNILTHLPFFQTWDEVFFTKDIVNLYPKGQIDNFLTKYQGHQPVKFNYVFWESGAKRMIYLSMNFPQHYSSGIKVYLKDIIVEKDGVMFSLLLMKGILGTQVEHS